MVNGGSSRFPPFYGGHPHQLKANLVELCAIGQQGEFASLESPVNQRFLRP